MIQDPARIERALRKAHEAGDTESAKKLAAAYKQAMAGTSPPAQTPPADPFASAPPNGGEGQQASAGQPLAPSTSPTGQAGALGGQPRPSAPGGQSLGVGSFSPRPPRGFGGLSLSEPPRTISSSLRLPVSREDIKREKEEGLLYLPPGMDGPVDTGSDFNLDQFAATRRQEQDAQFAQDQQALLATRKNPESRPFSEYQQYQNLSDPTGVGNVPVQDTRKQYVIEDYIESLIPEKREYMDTKVAAGKWTDEDAARMEMAAFSRQAEIVEARIADLDARYKSLQPIDPADVEDIKAQAQYVQSQVDQDFRAIVQRHPEMARELLEDKAVAQMKDVRRSVDPAYSVMYEGIINPAARAWARFGANILRTPRTFSFDDAYGWTDQLAEYAESVMDKADRRQPAAFQGPLVEEGKVHAERLLPKVSETIASSLLLVGGGGGFLPGLVANSFVQTNSDYFKEAVDAGATASQGGIYAAQASTVTSLLEGLSPQNYLFRQGLRTIGKQAVREMVGGKSLSEAFKRAKFVGKEIAEENVQEISQMVGDKLSASWGNAWLRVDNPGFSQALDDEYSMDEFMETVILTTAMSGLMSAPRAVGSNPVHAEAVQWAVENPDLFELALAKSEIPDADRLKAMDRLAQYSRAFKGMKPTGDAVRDKTIADAVLEKEKIKEEQGQTLVDDVVAAIAGNKFEERLKEQDQIIAQATGTTLADVIKKQEIAKLQEQYDKAKLKSEVTGKPMPEGGQVAPIPAAAQPEGPVRPEAKPGHQEQPATDAGTETVPAQEEGAGADIPDTEGDRKRAVKQAATDTGALFQKPTDRPATTGKLRTDKVAKALADFGVKIHTPKTQAEYDDALKNIGAEGISSSWGIYFPATKEIFINPKGPDLKQTLAHEAAHPIFLALYNSNRPLFDKFVAEVKRDHRAWDIIDWVNKNYAELSPEGKSHEILAQFAAHVWSGEIPVSTKPDSLWQKFKALIQDIMAALGWDTRSIDLSKPQNVRDFAAQFKKALDKGIKIVGLEGVTEGGPMMQIADIKGAVNIFGVDAVERDLATASNMEEGGKSPESIKLATGWERGVDGKWFYEIPDASLKDADTFAKALLSGKFDAESTIKDHFDAEEIFEAYPEIADYKIRIINEPSVGAEAEYSPIDKAITLNAARFIEEFKGRTPREVVARTNGMRGLRKVVAHELAHAVQDVSGFAAGGSPYMFDFVPADKRDATKVRELLSEYLEMTPEQKSERFGNLVAEGMTYWGPEKPEHQLRSLIDTSKTRVANAWGGEAKFLEWQVRLIDSLLRLPKWYMTSRQRYEALAGEVQARAVSAALDQSEQQRRSRTLKSLGSVPPEQQVVLSETPGTQAMMQKPSGATDAQWAGAVDAAVQAYTDSILEGNEDAQSLKAAMAAAAKTKGWGEMTKEARVAADRELRSMFEKASASQEKGTPSISGRRLRAEKEPTPKEKADIIAERLKHTPEKQDDVAGEVNSIIDQAFSDGMTLQQVEELIEAADTSPSNKMYARGRLHFEADKAAHDRALSQAERLEAAELSARMVNRMAKFGMEGGRANAMFYRVMKDFSTFSFDVNLKAAQQKADKLFNTPVEGVPLKDRIAEIQAALKKALAEDGDLSNAIGLIGKLNDILDQYATDLSKTTLKPGQHQDTSLAEAVRSPSKFAAKIRALEEALRAAKEDLARMKKNGRPQDVIDKAGARVEEIEKLRAELESLREGIKEERKEYDEKLTQYERLIAELVNRNIPKTKDGPLSSGKVQSKAVKALLEASLAGVMTQDFYKNLSEAFGLPYITPQMRAVLRALSDAVHEFQKGGQRELARRAMRALNTQVRKMTPKDAEFYYTLFDEMLHTNILSGINTFFNANQGSLFESMYAFAGLNISHLAKGNFGALAYAYGKLLRPEGLRTGRNKALNYTMAYDDLGSYFEGEAKRGMGAYEEFLKLGVAQGLAMAKDGEMKKGVTRLIGSLMLQGVNFAFNIRAIDAMLTHSFAEFQYALKDYDKIMKEMGVSNHMSPVAQVLSRMNPVPALKKLSQDGVQYQAALDQARKEVKDLKARGFKIGRYGFVMATKAINEKLAERWVNGYIKRRAQEILENDRDHDAMNSAIRMGKDSILMGDPDGVSGWLSERVASAFSTNKFNQASTPGKMAMVAFRATGLFFRVMANTWGRAVHNTPVIGAIAATYGLSKDPKTDKWTFGALWKRDPQRFKLRLASNALASAFVLAAWNMMFDLADDDDDDEDVKKIPFLGTRMKLNPDRLIDLTANAYSRYDKNMGISEDYQMFSIRFRTPEQAKAGEWGTPWLSMRLIPSLGGPLATVGRMADDVKGYGGLKEGEEENLSQRIRRETKWGTAAFGVLGQSSFNAIGRTVNKFNYASDIDQAYAGVIQDIALSPVTAMAQPTFYRDVINEAMFLADKPAKQRRRVHGMADLPPNFFGSLYGLDNLLFEDKVDRFGNPVPRVEKFSDNLKAFTGYQSNADRYPEVALLFKYEDLPLPAPDYRPRTIAGNEPDPRKPGSSLKLVLTGEEKERINAYHKQFLRAIVRMDYLPDGEWEGLETLGRDDLSAYLKNATLMAKEFARAQLVAERDGDTEVAKAIVDANEQAQRDLERIREAKK